MVATYHQARLADLLEHVRRGFAEYDAGQIDAFELDDLIHQYKRATIELWKFCGVSGSQLELVARRVGHTYSSEVGDADLFFQVRQR